MALDTAKKTSKAVSLAALIAEPALILDPSKLRRKINKAAKADPGELREVALEHLREANIRGRKLIAKGLKAEPMMVRCATQAYTYLTDQLVKLCIELVEKHLLPPPDATAKSQLSVLSVGGYGRAEMAPYSDVDLLFLTPDATEEWVEKAIENILYLLWDLKLKVGQAVRSVDECLTLGKTDITIRTALLEHRFLTGNRRLANQLDRRLWSELFDKTGPQFVEAKLAEREERHARHGGSRYMVEPNVKEGKGGLRDLQTLFWIAKYLNHARTPDDLVTMGVFDPDEFATFTEAETFLWATRCTLHLCAGRPTEQLTFDVQVEVARAMGYTDKQGRRDVEWFMQDYFTHAKSVGELTRIFLASLEAQHVKKSPGFARSILNAFNFGIQATAEGYVLKHGRLDVVDPDRFSKDPVNILRLFQEGLKSELLIHPDAMRLVNTNLDLIDETVRADPEANRIFLDLLLSSNNPERALRRMNELGVLGAFMPEFGRIDAMMQFNMYHHYTVDEHTVRCVSTLFQIEKGDLVEELPVASDILQKGVNRRVIYLATLLHDIGKGLPEDHSIAGERIAREVCTRLGLDTDEVDTVAWLVRHHLLMSDTAQKRDLSDPRTVQDFANIVQSPNRLKLLTVLTVCDIRGVGPGTWNNWKAMLLRELYALTLEALTGKTSRQSQPERVAEARENLAAKLHGWNAMEIAEECGRHYNSYWMGLDTSTQVVVANLIRQIKSDEPVSQIEQDEARDATRACFVMPDHPGIFSRIAGAIALAGANVVDGRTYTSKDGIVAAVFWIQDDDGSPYEAARLTRLRKLISQTLKGEVVAREAFKSKDKIKKREKEFIVPTEITFDNEGSEIFTIIEVDTRDRPGLLHDLTRTLSDNSISTSSAIIATYGEQAVDSFYVKDLFGLKIHAKSKQDAIAERLRNAIRLGTERAQE